MRAELPVGVWAHILVFASQQATRIRGTLSMDPFSSSCELQQAWILLSAGGALLGPCTLQLRLLIRAAAVSRTLRRAAAAAAAELELCLEPDALLPTMDLSRLLAELCCERPPASGSQPRWQSLHRQLPLWLQLVPAHCIWTRQTL